MINQPTKRPGTLPRFIDGGSTRYCSYIQDATLAKTKLSKTNRNRLPRRQAQLLFVLSRTVDATSCDALSRVWTEAESMPFKAEVRHQPPRRRPRLPLQISVTRACYQRDGAKQEILLSGRSSSRGVFLSRQSSVSKPLTPPPYAKCHRPVRGPRERPDFAGGNCRTYCRNARPREPRDFVPTRERIVFPATDFSRMFDFCKARRNRRVPHCPTARRP